MVRIKFALLAFTVAASAQTAPQGSPATVRHEANFEAERAQANALYGAGKPLEALPLYEDLCRQDPTIAVFAERRGAGLVAKEATMPNGTGTVAEANARLQVHLAAIREFKRAQSLGDDSAYIRTVLQADAKTLAGAILAGIPLTVGYTYHGTPAAQAGFQQAEAAFGKADYAGAAKLYVQAATLDPAWYEAALYAGDSYFRLKDSASAGAWFSKAVAIDPDRETAFRYWGDALFRDGQRDAARDRFVQAVIAEPYAGPPYAELQQWAEHTGHVLVRPAIVRPEFLTPDGVLKIDPVLEASTADGRSSWIVYEQFRVGRGARTLNQPILAGGIDKNAVVTTTGYRHTVAEEHAALRAMLADVDTKVKAGTLLESGLDASIRNLRNLERAGMLGAWIAINAADAGIRADYPEYRSHHRQHLLNYVNAYLIQNGPPQTGKPKGSTVAYDRCLGGNEQQQRQKQTPERNRRWRRVPGLRLYLVEVVEERWAARRGEGCGRGKHTRSRLRAGRTDGLHGRRSSGWGTGRGGRAGKQRVDLAELFLEKLQMGRCDAVFGACFAGGGVLAGAELGLEGLAGAGDGVPLVVEEVFDTEGHFDVASAVQALAGASLVGLELGELAFPETEDVGGNLAEPGDLADAEVKFVRDLAGGGVAGAAGTSGTFAD